MRHKLILLHRSVGWNKDSRIRKLMNSFQAKSFDVEVCIWERPNISKKIKVGSDAIIHCKKIPIASKNKIRGGIVLSGLEIIQEFFQGFFFIFFKNPTVIIIQNHRQFLHIFSAYIYKVLRFRDVQIVWDLREIPNGFGKYHITRWFFSFLCSIPKFIWVMNMGRLNYMLETYDLDKDKFYIVPNFCELKYWDANKDVIDKSISVFLDGFEYVYVQNPFSKERYGYNSIASVLMETDKKLICTGNISKQLESDLISYFGKDVVNRRVLFTGSLEENKLKALIDNCRFSIILYDSKIINNHFCDANRLYQCVARNIPVIVGQNPGLSSYVQSFNLGVVSKDDGYNIDFLRESVKKLDLMIDSSILTDFSSARENMAWEQNKYVFDLLG